MWCRGVLLLALMMCRYGSAKQPTSASGLSQFWTDDFKVFDQIYGKTSDKEIFGVTLPPSIAYNFDAARLNHQRHQASEKKERYIEQKQNSYIEESQDQDPYGFGSRFPSLTYETQKPVKPKFGNYFIPDDQTIINQNNDPETYEYLKHLELLQKKKERFLTNNAGGFKPYLKGGKPDDSEDYRSIQDILEAHEVRGTKDVDAEESDDKIKYLNQKPKVRGQVKKVKPLLTKGKPRCTTGRCRKRATTIYRGRTYLTRPMIRKIKKIIYH